MAQDYRISDTQPREPDVGQIGTLVRRINDDLQTIARGEVELARVELTKTIKVAAAQAAFILLAGLVALVGFGMLCAAAVPALEPVIEPLWLRLVLMALVYMGVGGAVAAMFAKRLKQDVTPPMARTTEEAKRTVQTVREGLRHG